MIHVLELESSLSGFIVNFKSEVAKFVPLNLRNAIFALAKNRNHKAVMSKW